MIRKVDGSDIYPMPTDCICVNCGASIESEAIAVWHLVIYAFQCAYCGTWYERITGLAVRLLEWEHA